MKVDGIRIYALLKEQQKTQAALSSCSGVTRGTINQIINGKSCKQETAEKIAAALGVSLSEITDKRK